MRSVTMFLLASNWERDFSCLSMSSSTFSRQHDSIKELNMGLKLITISIALPVEINHDSCLLDIGDKFLMFLDQSVKLSKFSGQSVKLSKFSGPL